MFCVAFQTKYCELSRLHVCCDVYEKECSCDCDICPQSHVAVKDVDEAESSEDEVKRNVLSEERLLLNQKLESLKFAYSDRARDGLISERYCF